MNRAHSSARISRAVSCQRPSATELLKHRFIKGAKKNAILVEPLEKYQKWRLKGNGDDESDDEKYASKGRRA